MTDAGDAFRRFSERVDDTLVERAGEVQTVLAGLRAAHGDDLDEAMDDHLQDLCGEIAAGAANQVSDADADDAIATVERLFSEGVTNGTPERRAAALLVGTTAEAVAALFAGTPTDEAVAANLVNV